MATVAVNFESNSAKFSTDMQSAAQRVAEVGYAGKAGAAVWREVATPLEAYNAKLVRLRELSEAGKVSQELLSRAVETAAEKYKAAQEKMQKQKKGEAGDRYSDILETAIGLGAGIEIKEYASRSLEAAESAKNLGLALGMTSQQYQQMDYSAKVAGVSTEAVAAGMNRLSKNVVEVASGASTNARTLTAALNMVHLSAAQLANESPQKAMADLGDRLKEIENPAQRAFVAETLMGRGAAQMIPYLLQGSAGMAKLNEEATKTGYALSTMDNQKLVELKEDITQAGLAMSGAANQVMVSLGPWIKDVAELVEEHPKLTAGVLGTAGAVSVLAVGLRQGGEIAGSVKSVFMGVGTAVKWLSASLNGRAAADVKASEATAMDTAALQKNTAAAIENASAQKAAAVAKEAGAAANTEKTGGGLLSRIGGFFGGGKGAAAATEAEGAVAAEGGGMLSGIGGAAASAVSMAIPFAAIATAAVGIDVAIKAVTLHEEQGVTLTHAWAEASYSVAGGFIQSAAAALHLTTFLGLAGAGLQDMHDKLDAARNQVGQMSHTKLTGSLDEQVQKQQALVDAMAQEQALAQAASAESHKEGRGEDSDATARSMAEMAKNKAAAQKTLESLQGQQMQAMADNGETKIQSFIQSLHQQRDAMLETSNASKIDAMAIAGAATADVAAARAIAGQVDALKARKAADEGMKRGLGTLGSFTERTEQAAHPGDRGTDQLAELRATAWADYAAKVKATNAVLAATPGTAAEKLKATAAAGAQLASDFGATITAINGAKGALDDLAKAKITDSFDQLKAKIADTMNAAKGQSEEAKAMAAFEKANPTATDANKSNEAGLLGQLDAATKLKKEMDEYRQIVEKTLTPQQKSAQQLAEMSDLLAKGLITKQQYAAAAAGIGKDGKGVSDEARGASGDAESRYGSGGKLNDARHDPTKAQNAKNLQDIAFYQQQIYNSQVNGVNNAGAVTVLQF